MILNLRQLAENQKNFEGKTLKPNLIFRSSYIDETIENINHLNSLNIDKIYDLRSKDEIENASSLSAIPTKVFSVGGDFKTKGDGEAKINFIAEYMVQFYQNNLVQSQKLKELIHDILNEPCSFLYHCTAGKDRTGIVSIVLMELFGFSRKQIYEEYLTIDDNLIAHLKKRIPKEFLPDNCQDIEDILSVKKEYIDAYYKGINTNYENFEDYAQNFLNLSSNDIQKLKEFYLTN